MKKMLWTVAVLAAAVVVSGCRDTRVAGVQRSQEEEAWERVISRNYPNYQAPRASAPAAYDNTEERTSARMEPALTPAGDPAPADPPAAAEPADEPAKTETPAESAQTETPAEPAKTEAVTEPAKAEGPAEQAKAETPAEPAKVEAPAEQAAKPAPPDPTGSTVYEVRSGDTLGKIAQKHYGSARYSNVIFKANSDILKNPNVLRPGMKLIIPKL